MRGPRYTQWHGAYELVSDMSGTERNGQRASRSCRSLGDEVTIVTNVLPVGEVEMPSQEESGLYDRPEATATPKSETE
ncbi:MAG: hypothetical protein R2873_34610 [Caldilineaceae bacterium]